MIRKKLKPYTKSNENNVNVVSKCIQIISEDVFIVSFHSKLCIHGIPSDYEYINTYIYMYLFFRGHVKNEKFTKFAITMSNDYQKEHSLCFW